MDPAVKEERKDPEALDMPQSHLYGSPGCTSPFPDPKCVWEGSG